MTSGDPALRRSALINYNAITLLVRNTENVPNVSTLQSPAYPVVPDAPNLTENAEFRQGFGYVKPRGLRINTDDRTVGI
jgi:hypothetical protein